MSTRACFAIGGCALLYGAAAWILILRWFAPAFPYQPNALGIVSVSTMLRYPAQQESIHAALAFAFPLAVSLALLFALRARVPRAARRAPALALPLVWVVLVPWPGRLAALFWFLAPLAFVATAPASADAPETADATSTPAPERELAMLSLAISAASAALFATVTLIAPGPARAPALYALAAALLAAAVGARVPPALAPRLAPLGLLALYPLASPFVSAPVHLIAVIALATVLRLDSRRAAWLQAACALVAITLDPNNLQRIPLALPESAGIASGYAYLAEHGQRLEWVDRWIGGEIPARDFLFLYGPAMLELPRAAFAVLGRSHAALLAAFHLQDLLGFACVLAAARALLRHPTTIVLALLFTIPFYLRSGLGALALVLLAGPLTTPRLLAAGACLGFASLYSQEFALAQAAAGVVALAYGRPAGFPRACLVWAAGALLVAAPYAAYLHSRAALLPIVGSMLEYPKLMFAGFGKVPYPSLVQMLPLALGSWMLLPGFSAYGRVLGGFYVLPFAYAIACAYLTARRLSSRPVAVRERLLAAIAVYGLISFRAGLGHSCLGHQEAILWPALLIAAFVVEALALRLIEHGRAGRVAAAALALAFPLSFAIKPAWKRLDESFRMFAPGTVPGYTGLLYEWIPAGGPRADEIRRVADAIARLTRPGDALLALPNGSAYHFLTARPNPTKYATFALMITAEHRADAVRALERRPPACVVYDLATPRLDGIPDELQLAELLAWVAARYEVREVIGSTQVLLPKRR